MPVLPPPPAASDARPAVDWVTTHLGHLSADVPRASGIRGGQAAADAALAALDLTGYSRRRSQVWPTSSRGASRMSPYVRHGLLTLPQLWAAAADAPPADRAKYRDELLWQEYARHLYARLGPALRQSLRSEPPVTAGDEVDPYPREMACMDACLDELEQDGWLVNQTRMWLASQWTVRAGRDWREGEDLLYRNLLDGSRAANRLGWHGRPEPARASRTGSRAGRSRSARPGCAATACCSGRARCRTGPTARRDRGSSRRTAWCAGRRTADRPRCSAPASPGRCG